MKAKVIIRNILLTLLVMLTIHLSARYLGFVMAPKYEFEYRGKTLETQDLSSYYFSNEKHNNADTLFVGSSHVFCSIDVNIMNKEYGKNALMLATSSQTLDLSYYAIMSAIPMQHPKRIFLETVCATFTEPRQKLLSTRALLNDLPNWSKGKLLAAKASGFPMYYFLYPITDLHNTWWKVRAKDFILPRLPEGERFCYYDERVMELDDWFPSPDIEGKEIPEDNLLWLNKILQLCRENDTELILFTAPFPATPEEQTVLRRIDDYAKENGIVYYNLMDDYKKIGIDFHTDFFDNQHLNTNGKRKVSRYMAENCMDF